MLETIRQLYFYDAWANDRIIRLLKSLPSPHARALNLLGHVLVSERIWFLRLKGEDTSTINKSPDLSISDCERHAGEMHEAYSVLLADLTEHDLARLLKYRNFKGDEFQTPIGEILLHVAMHGTYHRGQIATALRAGEIAPVDT
ncbi:MAG: DinB family protein, partial [Pyrinomonadaceae bacterium]